MDSLETFRSRGGHPDYSEDDIVYHFNDHGFRAPALDAAADLRVLVLGCSFVFGVGLAQRDLFHERFSARLGDATGRSVVDLNLGAASASNDFICHLGQIAIPRLRPDVVLIHFTFPARRDYIAADGDRVGFNPSGRGRSRRDVEIHGHFLALSNLHDDRLNLSRNYLALAALLRCTPWLCSFTRDEHRRSIEPVIDPAHVAGVLPELDLARDHSHPGRRSHEQLADAYWRGFVGRGFLDAVGGAA